jgi:hypothetical protein
VGAAAREIDRDPCRAGKDDDRRRDWLDRRRFYIDAVVTLAVATTGFGPLRQILRRKRLSAWRGTR